MAAAASAAAAQAGIAAADPAAPASGLAAQSLGALCCLISLFAVQGTCTPPSGWHAHLAPMSPLISLAGPVACHTHLQDLSPRYFDAQAGWFGVKLRATVPFGVDLALAYDGDFGWTHGCLDAVAATDGSVAHASNCGVPIVGVALWVAGFTAILSIIMSIPAALCVAGWMVHQELGLPNYAVALRLYLSAAGHRLRKLSCCCTAKKGCCAGPACCHATLTGLAAMFSAIAVRSPLICLAAHPMHPGGPLGLPPPLPMQCRPAVPWHKYGPSPQEIFGPSLGLFGQDYECESTVTPGWAAVLILLGALLNIAAVVLFFARNCRGGKTHSKATQAAPQDMTLHDPTTEPGTGSPMYDMTAIGPSAASAPAAVSDVPVPSMPEQPVVLSAAALVAPPPVLTTEPAPPLGVLPPPQ
eukprot:gene9761-1759_t